MSKLSTPKRILLDFTPVRLWRKMPLQARAGYLFALEINATISGLFYIHRSIDAAITSAGLLSLCTGFVLLCGAYLNDWWKD